MKNDTTTTSTDAASTTFNTWGRVALDQMERLGDLASQSTKMQTAALEQGREYFAYHMRLAADWQNWALETGRKAAGQIFASK